MSKQFSGRKKGGEWNDKIFFILPDTGKNKPININEIPGRYKNVFLENIIYVRRYKSPLYWFQLTSWLMHHAFVVFRTKSYFWSVEKYGDGFCIQMFETLNEVKDYTFEGEKRNTVIELDYDKGNINVETLIYYITKKEFGTKYYYLDFDSNCQGFAKRIYDVVRRGYNIPKWASMWIFNISFYLTYMDSKKSTLCEVYKLLNFDEDIKHVWMYYVPLPREQRRDKVHDHYYVVYITKRYIWSMEKNEDGIVIQVFKDINKVLPQRKNVMRNGQPTTIDDHKSNIRVSEILDHICKKELNILSNSDDFNSFAYRLFSIS